MYSMYKDILFCLNDCCTRSIEHIDPDHGLVNCSPAGVFAEDMVWARIHTVVSRVGSLSFTDRLTRLTNLLGRDAEACVCSTAMF